MVTRNARWSTKLGGVILLLGLSALPGRADTLITFESLADGTSVTNQFSGMTFTNATVLTAGASLNEFEFPPRSGNNVGFDDGGPITIRFATPILGFGGYFTYLEPLTLTAFDAGNNNLGSATSLFADNLALSGDLGSAPNEHLQVAAAGITKITISGDAAGASFVLDDATITTPEAVPEPASLGLLAFSAVLLGRKVYIQQQSR